MLTTREGCHWPNLGYLEKGGQDGQTRPRPRSWHEVDFSSALGAHPHRQTIKLAGEYLGARCRQVVSSRRHLSHGEEMQASKLIYLLCFAQCDPNGDSTELPEFCWGCAQPSGYRAVPTGAALTFTVTVFVPDLS